ncbi:MULTISPECIES: Rossmann-like and DUF2520 domain-containing protein [Actinomyces]|uniref:Rossmann-like and DUF2520 domain-containing protein n=1 Tax=Actinomyces TaxID=1654 RepID=UPI002281BC09|nr:MULTISPECIES: DUF2520 domain-containing protein [Actinomyces]
MGTERPGRLGVGVVGMGHVGPVIASALRGAGHAIVGVTASSPASLERAEVMLPGVPVLDVEHLVERSELVVLAVPDDQIEPLVKGLADLRVWQGGQLLAHTSGAHGTAVLEPARRLGAIPLAIHPAMTFTGTSIDIARLVGTPFAVTAPAPVLPIAQALVVELGGEPVVVAEEQRPLYHAALAHGANHLVTLVVQAQRALAEAGVEDTGAFMRPLLEAALDRVSREGEAGLSGPVARGDAGTVARHMEALLGSGDLDDVADTYAHMARATVRMLVASGRLPERTATEVLAALALGGAGT